MTSNPIIIIESLDPDDSLADTDFAILCALIPQMLASAALAQNDRKA